MSSRIRSTGWRTSTLGHHHWFAAGFIALFISIPAAGQDDSLPRLRQDTQQLRRSLDQLEARIRALENREPSPDAGASAPAGDSPGARAAPAHASSPVSMKRNWSQVRPGTPDDEVRALLGKPEKELRIDGNPVWYYVYPGVGRGSVFFTADRKVSSAQEPASGWSW